MRVLVVEDEVQLAKLIREGLMADGLLADVAIRGEDALWMAGSTAYDVICLDVNLPGIDGFETCRRLRADGIATPILMLTARDAVDDRITGLDTGADDYLVKPFDFGELLARLRALGRRQPATDGNELRVGDLTLDLATHRVRRAGTSSCRSRRSRSSRSSCAIPARCSLACSCWKGRGTRAMRTART